MKTYFYKIFGLCAGLSLILSGLPFDVLIARAANMSIRQEINIIDGYLGSASGSFATSSALVQIDTTQYNGATYYFEIVASTTSAVSSNFFLKNASTFATVATINFSNSNTYTLYRSTSFTPTSGANNYVVVAGNEAVQKGAIAARVVVLQTGATITNTETQIEIGNKETYASTATSTLAAPKYWLYDSSKWNGSPTFAVEVAYNRTVDVLAASSTTYTAAGTYNVVIPSTTASTSVQLWGGGGAGGGSSGTTGAGAGGAGGQYAKKTIQNLAGVTKTLVVAATKAGTSGANGSQGATSTWDTNIVVAGGGPGGLANSTASTTGNATGCVGDICFTGGTGGAGLNLTTGYGAGGGGGAGSTGAGGNSTAAGVAGSGTAAGGGNGGAKCTKSTSGSTGGSGTQAAGGGGGACSKNNAGGSTEIGGTGAAGQAIITDDINQLATTTIALQEDNGSFANWGTAGGNQEITVVPAGNASTPTRVRVSFTPTNGRNYRLVMKSGYNGATFAIYTAKIIVDQTSPTLLEPQYLLANTQLVSGTSLQNFLTQWISGEWITTSQTFIHEVDSNAGSSVVEVDTAGGTQVSGSSLTTNAVRKQSGSLTMPSDGNLDVKATTNNGNVYGSRILAQINLTVASIPSGALNGLIRLKNGVMRLLRTTVRIK